MTNTLSCVVNPSTSENNYGNLFGYVCQHDPKACAGIAANASTGTYGAYGMCSPSEQLSFVFDQYYVDQHRSANACSFKGAAKLQKASSASGNCKALIAQAGTGGTGTVTSAPTGTGAGAAGGGAASSSGAAGMNSVPSAETGLFPMAFIVSLAALSGMGMVWL